MLKLYSLENKTSGDFEKDFNNVQEIFFDVFDFLKEISPQLEISKSRQRENLEKFEDKIKSFKMKKRKLLRINKILKSEKEKYKILIEIKNMIEELEDNSSFIDQDTSTKISGLMKNIEKADINKVQKVKKIIQNMYSQI